MMEENIMWVIDNELYHHGISGQKWGIRRYQNEDGTLTAEGEERYYDGSSRRKQLAEKIKNLMTYRDEQGNLHLTETGKKTAIGTAGAVGTAALAGGIGLAYRRHVKSYGQGNYKRGKANIKAIKEAGKTTKNMAKNMSFDQLKKHRYSTMGMVNNIKAGKSIYGMNYRNPDVYTKDFIKRWKTVDRAYATEYHKRLVKNSLRNLLKR